MIQIRNRTLIIGLLIAFGVTFLGGWLLGRFNRDNASRTIIQGLNETMRIYTYQIDGLLKTANEKDAIIATQRQAIREGIVLKEELRILKLKYVRDLTRVNGTIEILIDSIAQFRPVVIPCPPDELYHPVLYLPLAWRDSTEYYDISGEFDTTGVLSMRVGAPVDLNVWIGNDSEIKGNVKTVVTSLNPFVKIKDIKSFVFDMPKPKKWGIGITGGYGVAYTEKKIVPSPFIGLGITRTILRF